MINTLPPAVATALIYFVFDQPLEYDAQSLCWLGRRRGEHGGAGALANAAANELITRGLAAVVRRIPAPDAAAIAVLVPTDKGIALVREIAPAAGKPRPQPPKGLL